MSVQVDALQPERSPGAALRLAYSSGRPRRRLGARPVVPNAVIGTLIFLGAEAMFFGGLLSALLVLRGGVEVWPPVDQPRLPIAVTALNTFVLLCSAYTMRRAADGVRHDRGRELRRWLTATAVLGTTFLAVQGVEWIRLVRYGLDATASTYGGTFYTLIGCHALHVLVGVVVLLAVLGGAIQGRYTSRTCAAVEACRLYWCFVVGIWPVLYVLVYLL